MRELCLGGGEHDEGRHALLAGIGPQAETIRSRPVCRSQDRYEPLCEVRGSYCACSELQGLKRGFSWIVVRALAPASRLRELDRQQNPWL